LDRRKHQHRHRQQSRHRHWCGRGQHNGHCDFELDQRLDHSYYHACGTGFDCCHPRHSAIRWARHSSSPPPALIPITARKTSPAQCSGVSDTTAVATISNDAATQGLASSESPGSSIITATSGSVTSSTTLTVTSAALVSLAITPATPSIALGTAQQFIATGTFTNGTAQDLTSTATWTSDTLSTATINTAGLAQSKGLGTSNITATSGAVSSSTLVTVTAATLVSIAIDPPTSTIPLGTTQQFTATGTFTDGMMQDLTQSGHWSSTAAGVATISNTAATAGLASTLGTGTTTIGISYNSVSAQAALTVNPAVLASIAISPQTPTIALGTTQQFTATGTYTRRQPQDLTSVATWSSSDANVPSSATVSAAMGWQRVPDKAPPPSPPLPTPSPVPRRLR